MVCGVWFCVVGKFWNEGEHVRVSCRSMYMERNGGDWGNI